MAYLESSKRSLSGLEPGASCVLIWLGVSQGERERAPVSSYEGTKPIRKAPPKGPPLILTSSQRPHLQRPSRWGAGFQHVNFSRKQTASIGRTPRSPSPLPNWTPFAFCLTRETHPSRGTCHPGKSHCPLRAPRRRRFSTSLAEKQGFHRQAGRSTRTDFFTPAGFKNVEMPIIKNRVSQELPRCAP